MVCSTCDNAKINVRLSVALTLLIISVNFDWMNICMQVEGRPLFSVHLSLALLIDMKERIKSRAFWDRLHIALPFVTPHPIGKNSLSMIPGFSAVPSSAKLWPTAPSTVNAARRETSSCPLIIAAANSCTTCAVELFA